MKVNKFLLLLVIWTFYSFESKGQIIPEEEYGKWGLTDMETDRLVVDFIYDEIINNYSGYFPVRKGKMWGVIDARGKKLVPFEYDNIRDDNLGFLVVQKNQRKGVIDTSNSIIIEIKYEDIDNFDKDSTALVKQNGQWGYIKNDKFIENRPIVFFNPDAKALFSKCKRCSKEEAERHSERSLLRFISKKLKYPKEARKQNISGMIVVSFVINESGDIESPKILKDIGGNCGQAGIDVVNMLPQWNKPAIKDGEFVKYQFNLPLKFGLLFLD